MDTIVDCIDDIDFDNLPLSINDDYEYKQLAVRFGNGNMAKLNETITHLDEIQLKVKKIYGTIIKRQKLHPTQALLCLYNYNIDEALTMINISNRSTTGPKDKNTQQLVNCFIFEGTLIKCDDIKRNLKNNELLYNDLLQHHENFTFEGHYYGRISDSVYEMQINKQMDYKVISSSSSSSSTKQLCKNLYDNMIISYSMTNQYPQKTKSVICVRPFFGYIDQLCPTIATKLEALRNFSNYSNWNTTLNSYQDNEQLLFNIYTLCYDTVMFSNVTFCQFNHHYHHEETSQKFLNHLKKRYTFFTVAAAAAVTTTIQSGGSITPLSCNRNLGNIIDILLEGSPKLWLIIDNSQRVQLEGAFKKNTEMLDLCKSPLLHNKYSVSLDFLRRNNIHFELIVQKIGDVVIVREGVYYQSICLGVSISEHMYYDSHHTYINYFLMSNYFCTCPEILSYKKQFEQQTNPSGQTGIVVNLTCKTTKKRLTCSLCKEFSSTDNMLLQQHIKEAHYNVAIKYSCELLNCNESFANQYDKYHHEKYAHGTLDVDQCIFCLQKFNRVFKHIETAHDYAINPCLTPFLPFKQKYFELLQKLLQTFELLSLEEYKKIAYQELRLLEGTILEKYAVDLTNILQQTLEEKNVNGKKVYIACKIKKLEKTLNIVEDRKRTCMHCKKVFRHSWSKLRHEKGQVCIRKNKK